MKKVNKKSIVLGLKILTILAFGLLFIPALASAEGGTNTTFGSFGNGQNYVNYGGYNNNYYNNYQTYNPVPSVSSISPASGYVGGTTRTITITGAGFMVSSVARINDVDHPTTFIDYSHLVVAVNPNDLYGQNGFFVTVRNPGPGGGYSNAAFFTLKPVPAVSTNKVPAPAASYNTTNTVDNSDLNQNSTANGQPITSGDVENLAGAAVLGTNSFLPTGLVQWILFAILVLLVVILVRRIFGQREMYLAAPLKHE